MKMPQLITADALLNKDWTWTFTKAPVGDKIYSAMSRPVAQPFYQPFQRFRLAYGVLVGNITHFNGLTNNGILCNQRTS